MKAAQLGIAERITLWFVGCVGWWMTSIWQLGFAV